MGTAPTDRQPPVMPDAIRLVHRSLGVLQRIGMTEQQGLAVVIDVARDVLFRLTDAGFRDTDWLVQVVQIAEARAAAPVPSITDREVIENADGTGSRAGSPAEGTAG